MNTSTVGPARVQFGAVLRTHREARHLTHRRVADMLGRTIADVEAFEDGRLVPEGKTWDKYKGIVDRRLPAYSELRNRALVEFQSERKIITEAMEHKRMNTTTNGTNGHRKPEPPLAHKPFSGITDVRLPTATNIGIPTPDSPAGVVATATPPHPIDEKRIASGRQPQITAGEQLGQDRGTAKDGRRLMPDRPPGSMGRKAIEERIAWARLQFRSRPKMPINGPDGLLVIMRNRFGIGLDPDVCQRIKAEIQAELGQLPPSVPAGIIPLKPTPAAVQEAIDAGRKPSQAALEVLAAAQNPGPIMASNKPRDPEPGAKVNEADLAAAVDLVLGAVPGLMAFSISVDEYGEASVEYTVREVVVHERGGSMKVKR